MGGVYRDPAPDPPAPAELAYFAAGSRNESSVAVMFQLFSVPLVAAVAGAALVGPWAGLGALAASGAFVVWRRRSATTAQGARLRVERGDLVVLTARGAKETARGRLASLRDVALETKTIQMVQEGSSAIPAMRFIDTKVGPSVDKARIVLVFEAGEVRLGDDFVAHMDATEWLGKIRVFLRKHGWVPADEREEEDDDDEARDAG
jgi:hypothetical protein